MSRKEKHVFFVQSDFHYMICCSIIKQNRLELNSCYFVCRRGVKIEDRMQLYPFPFEGGLKNYLLNRKSVGAFYKDCDVTIYTPFRFLFPRRVYAKDSVFFEEGLSSYRLKEEVVRKMRHSVIQHLKRILKYLYCTLVMSVLKKDVRAYVAGMFDNTEIDPLHTTTIYTCSPNAYADWNSQLLRKKVLTSFVNTVEHYDVPPKSFFLVLDRFASSAIYSHDAYMKCVRAMLNYCSDNHINEVWTKFHPADWQNESAKHDLEECAKGLNIKFKFFEGHLEYLAVQNLGIKFISIGSTILFYAPILGNTNSSVSFVRFLYDIDDKYKSYIGLYGGIDSFICFFSEQVECLRF